MGCCYLMLRFGAVVGVWHDFDFVRLACVAKRKS